jgi:hypothetical protein
VIAYQAPGPDQEAILVGSFTQEIEVDGTVGIAVEDGHRPLPRWVTWCGCRRLLQERFWAFDSTVALPLTDLKIVFEYTVPGFPPVEEFITSREITF